MAASANAVRRSSWSPHFTTSPTSRPKMSCTKPNADFLLAFDAGTGSVRAQLFELRAPDEPVPCGPRIAIPYDAETGDERELSAVRWAEQVESAIAQAAMAAPKGAEVVLAGATFLHSILGIDPADRPITPLFTWADTESAATAEELRNEFDPEEYHQRTGCFLHPCFPFARLARLRRADGIEWHRGQRWVSSGGWLHLRWTGAATVGHGLAAGSGLYDLHSAGWDPDLVSALDLVPHQLERLVEHDECLPLRRRPGSRLPENLSGLLPIWPDAACSNIGSGCVEQTQWALNLGTSGALRVLTTIPDPGCIPPGLFCYRLTQERVLLGGATNNCGSLIHWLARTLRLGEEPLTYAQLVQRAGTATVPHAIPHLTGERSPDWPPRAAAAWTGIRLDTNAEALALSMLDAMAEQFGAIAMGLRSAVGDPACVVAGGGGAGDPSLVSRLAQAIGAPIAIAPDPETTLRGVAMAGAHHEWT